MLALIILLAILIGVLGFSTWNLLKKLEKLEDTVQNQQKYVEDISNVLEDSSKRLREIDSKGSFSSDDEVGFFFENLKQIQNVLDAYILK